MRIDAVILLPYGCKVICKAHQGSLRIELNYILQGFILADQKSSFVSLIRIQSPDGMCYEWQGSTFQLKEQHNICVEHVCTSLTDNSLKEKSPERWHWPCLRAHVMSQWASDMSEQISVWSYKESAVQQIELQLCMKDDGHQENLSCNIFHIHNCCFIPDKTSSSYRPSMQQTM